MNILKKILSESNVHAMSARVTPKDKMNADTVFGANPHTKDVRFHVKAKNSNHAHEEATKHLEKKGYHVHSTKDNGYVNKHSAKPVNEQTDISEGMRLIKTHQLGNHTAKVYKDSDWGEHRVKYYKDGKHLTKADSHHDDAQDAHDTAKAQLKRMNEETEQLDEISKKTLASYVSKATVDVANKARQDGIHIAKNEPSNKKDTNKILNRIRGVSKAAARLSKEEISSFAEYMTEEEKATSVPTYTTADAAEAAAKSYYQRAKQTPESESEKKKHYLYIARKLYTQARRLRHNKPKIEGYEISLEDGNVLEISEELYIKLSELDISEEVFTDLVSFENLIDSLDNE